MTAAYEFVGDEQMYPWGVVHRGDIAYFTGRAPDGDWREFVPTAVEAEPVVESEERPHVDLRRPNRAASAADWRAYAKADSEFLDDPDTLTRQAIVDRYYGEGDDQ